MHLLKFFKKKNIINDSSETRKNDVNSYIAPFDPAEMPNDKSEETVNAQVEKKTNREIMVSALKRTVVKELREKGFKGSYPRFKKVMPDCIEFINFQSDFRGGSFVVEVSSVFPNNKYTNLSRAADNIDINKLNVGYAEERYRLKGMFKGWFYYSDVYKMPDGMYCSVSEKAKEKYYIPENWELVQVFNEKMAETICEKVSLQFEDAFKWMSAIEYLYLKTDFVSERKSYDNLKPDVEAWFEFNGAREGIIAEGYRPAHLIKDDYLTTGMHRYYDDHIILPDESAKGTITFISPEAYPHTLWVGKKIAMQEGSRIIGYATVLKVFNPVLLKEDNTNYHNVIPILK